MMYFINKWMTTYNKNIFVFFYSGQCRNGRVLGLMLMNGRAQSLARLALIEILDLLSGSRSFSPVLLAD